MKKCIWCSKDENNTTFKKKAHTIPKSLGGRNICINVCDDCNKYFGNKPYKLPGIEIAIKEVLRVSQYELLRFIHKPIPLKSEYFKIKNGHIRARFSNSRIPNFEQKFIRQFKRGIYKIFLEERERQKGDAHDNKFNFIREFSRFDLNDYPVFYVLPFKGVVLFQEYDTRHPTIRFTEYSDEMEKTYNMFEYILLGHRIVIPISKLYNLTFDSFKQFLKKQNVRLMGDELIEIKHISDIDFMFDHLRDN